MAYRRFCCFALVGGLLMLGGCGGSASSGGGVTGTPIVGGTPLASGGAASVYVSQLLAGGSNPQPAGVLVLPATATGTVTATSTLPILSGYVPSDIAVDSTGQIYTGLNFYNNYTMPTLVAVYAAGASGSATPLRIINGGAAGFTPNGPGPLAIDPAGLLYALQGTGGVSVYAANASGATAAVRTIKISDAASSNGSAITGLAADKMGTLYTGGSEAFNPVIYALPAASSGTVTPARIITGIGSGAIQAIDTDAAGNLYVMRTTGSTSTITEYGPTANGAASPLRTIAPAATYLIAMKVDVAGNIYGLGYTTSGTTTTTEVVGFGPAASGVAVPSVTIMFASGIVLSLAVR